jgi:hypothetical protein
MCQNPEAIHILEKNQDKIDWNSISFNSEIFDYSYEYLEERCSIYKEELIAIALHPSRIEEYLKQGIPLDELDNYI